MKQTDIYIGNSKRNIDQSEISGKLVSFENEDYYKISNVDSMRPFFMSIVSDANHWIFVSSNGGLTAGRKDSGFALFPYYTDDKISESSDITGSKTILHVVKDGKTQLWEPFSERYVGIYRTIRNLYKNCFGNKVIFEEINEDLDLTFRYQWNSSDQFGFVKKSTLLNNSDHEIKVCILDGIQNLMPYGVDTGLQATSSNLVDAYKKNELEAEVGLGIYALSAVIVDRAEPSEALKATTVWSLGIENPTHLVSSLQLNDFRKGKKLIQEVDVRAEKGAYFISKELNLSANSERQWMFIADVNKSVSSIVEITQKIKNSNDLASLILDDIELGTKHLLELNGAADGIQLTNDKLRDTRHFANTLFNIMRGGIFDNNYTIEKVDFLRYTKNANKEIFRSKEDLLNDLPELFSLEELRTVISALDNNNANKNFARISFEYLPLKFSRRHGDPSRPWNKFSINTRNEDGSKILDYQGNWRDIFQNWEALAHSYPQFMENMIHKFLNATTFDGYNPYRVTKDGFDWETIEADDPWSYIGYWGDHQVIYLLKFLEFIEKYSPSGLTKYFDDDVFVYANVPYKIKPYADILRNPKDTVVLDTDSEKRIHQKRQVLGSDGALLTSKNQCIYQVNLIEKLLATILAKMSNFIPEAGIWMNTQRPEWNDANNALVGNGVSMVTLYYLHRFLNFFECIVENSPVENYGVSIELIEFFKRVWHTLEVNSHILSGKISDTDRKSVLDGLGSAASDYRGIIYENGFIGEKKNISKKQLLQFLLISNLYLKHSISTNQREDKLFHAYNLMTVENDTKVSVSHLAEMLEGQVAVLSSGYLSGEKSLEVLNALKGSALLRADQYSYVLYPNKELARFTKKNNIPIDKIEKSQLIRELLEDHNYTIVEKDVMGGYHFNGNFNNADSLKKALLQLQQQNYEKLVQKDTELLLEIFEDNFNHKSFTGRSGTFYGYEGLGSIYWHMVSKLLLSVQEVCLKAIENKESNIIIDGLFTHYYEINAGIGVHKSPELYGAFPTDPYSHTPGGKGAQQPGMTGQVKEDILCRFGELGIVVSSGILAFNPQLLKKEEFLKKPMSFQYRAIDKQVRYLDLNEGELAFTYCQVPVIYTLSNKKGLSVELTNGKILEFNSIQLDEDISSKIFKRTGEVVQIKMYVSL
ncbi:hypothetical protein ACOCEA_06980 [Maribacter sp. CXY002]|uniref:hypothetical protein n=1 Tax=Maribacter luteocoastalis TaxID=3407671 RepID=UPI003B6713C2